MADLAKLVVRLEAQSAQMIAELEKANNRIDRFASQTNKTLNRWAAGLVSAFSVQAIFGFVKGVVDAEDNLNDMAQKAGATVERVSQLGYAASQSGSDLEGLAAGLKKLAANAADAANGSKSAEKAFDTLGIKVTDQNGALKASDQLLIEIADQFAQYEDGAGKAAIAQDLFGKSGVDLIPFLNQGAAGIKQLTDEADRLGITVSTRSVKAADEFNDSLDKLQKTAAGLVGGSLAQGLERITEAVNLLAEDAGGIERFSTQVATGFKLIIDIGYSVYKTFDDIGTSLGALGAAAVAFASGDFGRAREIMKLASEDQKKSEADANAFLERLWSDRALDISKAANSAADGLDAADKRAKKTFFYGDRVSPVQEVDTTPRKIETDPMQKFYDDLDKLSQTSSERQVARYYEQRAAIKALYDDGKISLQQYNDRVTAAQDELLPEFEVTAKKVQEIAEKANEYEIEAARNTQDIIAGTFESLATGADLSAQGILKSFGDMIVKLTAQAIAADLAGKLFGTAGGGTGGGWLGAAASFFGFGGTMDAGGRGQPGVAYAIGTGAQPEVYVPDTAGTFMPADKWGNGGQGKTINNNFYLPSNDPPSRRTQDQIAASAYRGLNRGNQRGN